MTDAVLTKEVEEAQSKSIEQLPLINPPVDIYQNEDEFLLVAQMPGVNESSVDIVLDKGVLTIEGRICDRELAGYKLAHCEALTGNYRRLFRLTEDLDLENADAVMKDGVLTLRLPKHEKARARKINVRSN